MFWIVTVFVHLSVIIIRNILKVLSALKHLQRHLSLVCRLGGRDSWEGGERLVLAVARTLLSQFVAQLLQGLVLRLRHVEVDEGQREDAHDEVAGEDCREGEGVHEVQECDGHHRVGRPVDSLAKTDGPRLQVKGEQLRQEDPGDRTEADAVGRDVGHQRHEGDVGDVSGQFWLTKALGAG